MSEKQIGHVPRNIQIKSGKNLRMPAIIISIN
jgi:hypothetical protein